MTPTVVLVGTLDTKGEEYAFLREEVERAGCEALVVDVGIVGDPAFAPEVGRDEVAAAGGAVLADLVAAGDRGAAVATMAAGAAAVVVSLFAAGRLDGVLGAAGSGGSSIISRAMRALPVGVPKVLVSTMAAGDVGAFVGTSDIAMVYSVVDVAGVNSVSRQVLGNAAAGVAAMAAARRERAGEAGSRPVVGATMYGTTTPCVNRARRWLEEAGYEVLVFHATGSGGRTMEALMEQGAITASLDITTTELTDEVAGGVMTAGPDRLETAGRLGLPQVVSLGATDMVTFTPPEAVPPTWADRRAYAHNPSITLVRSSVDEVREVGRLIAEKLNAAVGPTSLFVPRRGTSSYAVEGGVFHDPAADAALFGAVREHLGPGVELVEMDTDINDPAFAIAMAERLHDHYRMGD